MKQTCFIMNNNEVIFFLISFYFFAFSARNIKWLSKSNEDSTIKKKKKKEKEPHDFRQFTCPGFLVCIIKASAYGHDF